MKKYLIRGALALVASATFISCHTDDEFSDSLVANKLQTYEEVFKQEFGDINPNQDWGFGTVSRQARTVVANRTRTSSDNINLWGDPNADGGAWNWNVPPALTPGQKTRVMAYFQANPYLTYVDPHLTDFFVQQVYKGDPTTAGAISSEEYTQTNGNKLTGSENMDWLFAGEGYDHIDDFNDGDWNNGIAHEVLNTGQSTNDHQGNTTHVEGVTHPDQITLMVGSSTEFIAYGSSTGSVKHTDCCALAGWRVIEAWAIAHEDSLKAIGKFGDTLDDGWDRSFVGLDYEDRTVDGLYSRNKIYAYALDFCEADYVLYRGRLVEKNNFANFQLIDPKGDGVRYIIDDVSNQAIADYIKYTNNNNEVVNVTKDAYNYNISKAEFATYGITITNGEARIYNLDMVIGYVNQSALPTDNNGNWVKNIGGRDYVFSDWIVTLTPAYKQGAHDPKTDVIPIEPGVQGGDEVETWIYYRYKRQLHDSGRIFCEDLGVISSSDLDFNDVVFDAYIYDMIPYKKTIIKTNGVETTNTGWVIDTDHANYAYRFADIYVLAGGGTLPVNLAGEDFKNLWGQVEITDNVLVNTINEEIGSYGNTYRNNNNYGTILNYQRQGTDWGLIDIPIIVTFSGHQLLELRADPGKAPHKICVPIKTAWPYERIEIKEAYTSFSKYVGSRGAYQEVETNNDYSGETYWKNPASGTVYVGDGQITDIKYAHLLPIASTGNNDNDNENYFDMSFGISDFHEKIDGRSSSGYQNGDPVLVRRRH